ncbi:Undecaprenyl-phosphate glucose phosphotransferase [Rhizobiales bacterium GAS113]|nr:Undecaprenyl-phosphate glucose phosphotransferase [Rhizobiales bacterium GAS113]
MYIDRHMLADTAATSPSPRALRGLSRQERPFLVWLFGRRSFLPHGQAGLLRSLLSFGACLTEMGAILASSIVVGLAYHVVFYGEAGVVGNYTEAGLVIGLLFAAPNASRSTYSIESLLSFPSGLRRAFTLWNVAFCAALGLGFMVKATADFSRGAVLLFYVCGFGSIVLARLLLVGVAREIAERGVAALRQVFLVGREADVETFRSRCESTTCGLRIVGASLLRDDGAKGDRSRREEELAEDIRLAVSVARFRRPEDVFIMLPWSDKETIERCIEAFLTVPASIHLDPEKILSRFEDLKISRLGPVLGLNLVREPLSVLEVLVKRLFDLVVSTVALILLAPIFLMIAILIKLDTPGPVFFVQRRYGFNQEPFPIFKFRSMTIGASEGEFQQATKNDVRITAIGRFLRRWNFDELPQLLNVFLGEMSLVGPRPHAVPHDHAFQDRVALYARRHNVKPGITGWAQINGLRGETATDETMRARVEHDLHYIDNWSFWFDLRIILMTVLSGKAYRNAY